MPKKDIKEERSAAAAAAPPPKTSHPIVPRSVAATFKAKEATFKVLKQSLMI